MEPISVNVFMDNIQSKKLIEKLINWYRKCHQERRHEVDNLISSMEKYLAGDHWTAVKVLPSDLNNLAGYRELHAVPALIDGDSTGWRAIDAAVQCQYWVVKLRSAGFFERVKRGEHRPGLGLDLDVPKTACVTCYSILHGLENWQCEMQDILIAVDTTPAMTDPGFWQQRNFEPFSMLLYQKLHGGNLPGNIGHRDLELYGEVLANWDIPTSLAATLMKLCDYHCTKMEDRGGRLPEFNPSPFSLYPVEILAIYKVREQLGLETPIIAHPLMSTPLASLAPREIAPVNDPIIQRVEKLYHDFFGHT